MSTPPPLQDPALAELRDFYTAGELILFVGAGFSMAAGLPSWAQLVREVIQYSRLRGADATRISEMETLLQRGEFIDALSVAQELLRGPDFGALVERQLDDKGRPLPEGLQAVAKLGPRLRAVLTTNLDHLLERALQWPALWRAQADLARRRQYIFKFHGTLLDRSSWVFTREQYDRAMAADPLLHPTLSRLFHSFPLLFVGFGLVDDDFETLLTRVRALSGDQPPRHFALVPQGSLQSQRRARVERAGIRLIEYPNPDGKHAEVVRILEWLAT